MADIESNSEQVMEQARIAATELVAARKQPCVLLVDQTIGRSDVQVLREALGGLVGPAMDVVLFTHGGSADAAYALARELRRRFDRVTVFVPGCAKSAGTLFCLAADEIVVGPLGELGPLDAQCDESQKADFPLSVSRLALFEAFEQLQQTALEMFGAAFGRVGAASRMRPYDVAAKAAELTGSLLGPIFAQIDPIRLAEAARGLEVGCEYAARLLTRYRPDVDEKTRHRIIQRLVHGYPSHGFMLDYEELVDLGLPVRPPNEDEGLAVERLTRALVRCDMPMELIEVVAPAEEVDATDPSAREEAGEAEASRALAVTS